MRQSLYGKEEKAVLLNRTVFNDFYYKLVLLNVAIIGFSITMFQNSGIDNYQHHYEFSKLIIGWAHQFLAVIVGFFLINGNMKYVSNFNLFIGHLEDNEGSVEYCMPKVKSISFIARLLEFIYYYLTVIGLGFLFYYSISING